MPRSLYEKLCPPPWEEPCLFDLRELEPARLTGSDVPAGLAALAVVPLKDENGLWGAAVLCWAAAPSHLITPHLNNEYFYIFIYNQLLLNNSFLNNFLWINLNKASLGFN